MSHDWKKIAEKRGFETVDAMWRAMYATHSIVELAAKLGVSIYTVRVQLAENNVDVRPRGGPNYVKADLSDVTEEDIQTKGCRQIAKEKGISPTAVYKRLIYSKGRHLRPVPGESPVEPEPLAATEDPNPESRQ